MLEKGHGCGRILQKYSAGRDYIVNSAHVGSDVGKAVEQCSGYFKPEQIVIGLRIVNILPCAVFEGSGRRRCLLTGASLEQHARHNVSHALAGREVIVIGLVAPYIVKYHGNTVNKVYIVGICHGY